MNRYQVSRLSQPGKRKLSGRMVGGRGETHSNLASQSILRLSYSDTMEGKVWFDPSAFLLPTNKPSRINTLGSTPHTMAL